MNKHQNHTSFSYNHILWNILSRGESQVPLNEEADRTLSHNSPPPLLLPPTLDLDNYMCNLSSTISWGWKRKCFKCYCIKKHIDHFHIHLLTYFLSCFSNKHHSTVWYTLTYIRTCCLLPTSDRELFMQWYIVNQHLPTQIQQVLPCGLSCVYWNTTVLSNQSFWWQTILWYWSKQVHFTCTYFCNLTVQWNPFIQDPLQDQTKCPVYRDFRFIGVIYLAICRFGITGHVQYRGNYCIKRVQFARFHCSLHICTYINRNPLLIDI